MYLAEAVSAGDLRLNGQTSVPQNARGSRQAHRRAQTSAVR
jgi:hypothetical protein